MDRVSKENYYLDIAQTVTERATCLRRVYGAIIVKNDEIISTGYNGAPRGRKNCVDLGYCTREAMQVPRGQRYELCRSVHAEANAIISASRRDMVGGTIYLVGRDAATTSWAATPPPARCWGTPTPAPCAAARSSTRGWSVSSSAAPPRNTSLCRFPAGSTRMILCQLFNKSIIK